MPAFATDDRYVAEVAIPGAVFGPESLRGAVPAPAAFDVERGYWRVWYHSEQAVGLVLTVEFAAPTYREAEELALECGRRFGRVLSLWSGSPAAEPRLTRIAKVGALGLITQRSYVYQAEVPTYPSVPLDRAAFERMLARYGELETPRRDALNRGLRWYAIAVGAAGDPSTQYLAAWIGLESIGAELHRRYHPIPRAKCDVCESPSGENRKGVEAGLQHLLRRALPEVVHGKDDYFRLAQIRHDIAHGLTDADTYEDAARPLSPDIVLALGSALLTLFARPSATPRSWQSYLPREYAPQPDAMAELSASSELPEHDPWTGGWVNLEVDLRVERTTEAGTGEPLTKLLPLVQYGYSKPQGQAEAETRFVIYQRHGHISSDIDIAAVTASPHYRGPAPTEQWHSRPLTASWERLLQERRMASTDGETTD